MRKLLLLFILSISLSSCINDESPFNFKGKDHLPEETQTGANTVGCLVNGKVFLPHNQGLNSGVNCFYQLVNGERIFNITCADFRGVIPKAVSVFTGKINLEVGQTYTLNQNSETVLDIAGAGGNYDIGADNRYFTNQLNSGELKITRLDLKNSIISGTFWFDAVNSKDEKVEIREGRFDWQY